MPDPFWLLWSPMPLNSCSICPRNLHVAFSRELPLTCPVLLWDILYLERKYSLGSASLPPTYGKLSQEETAGQQFLGQN